MSTYAIKAIVGGFALLIHFCCMFNATSLQDFRCMNPDETQSLQSSITIQPPLVSEQGYDRFLNLYNYAGHNVMGQALKKRTYHDFENKPSIAPKMIFDGVMESIHSLITPPNKVAKLCDSQELAWFCPQDTPTAAESDDENNSIEEEEQSNFLNDLSLSSSSESNYSFESVSGDDEDSDFEIEDKETKPATSKRLPCSDKTIPTTNDTEPVEISAKIEFGKRGNGNQPWETCAPPPKIGKMRKMCVKLKSLSAIARTVQLQIRTEDKDPELHKGKLVLCSDDRCCTKGKDTKKKRSVQCAERLTELVLPAAEISCAKPYSVEVFLKPEWNGLGKNKTRPSFDVFVELVDMSSGKVHELLSFDTELQSHKFESSAKARAIEKASTATKRKTICL